MYITRLLESRILAMTWVRGLCDPVIEKAPCLKLSRYTQDHHLTWAGLFRIGTNKTVPIIEVSLLGRYTCLQDYNDCCGIQRVYNVHVHVHVHCANCSHIETYIVTTIIFYHVNFFTISITQNECKRQERY